MQGKNPKASAGTSIKPATGRLGILTPGLGAVATTFIAGVESIRTIYIPMTSQPATRVTGVVNVVVTAFLLAGVTVIIFGCARRWLRTIRTEASPPLASAG